MKQLNKKGFSIIIGMMLVILITLSAYMILAYILPFSKDTKGIENASNAYYQSYSGVEQALHHIKNRGTLTAESSSSMPTTSTGISFQTFSSGANIPKSGEGNSEYSSGYNIISQNEPLQLEIGRNSHAVNDLWNHNINFLFKVPSLQGDTTVLTLSGGTNYPIINWILSAQSDTLIASGSWVRASGSNGVNTSDDSSTPWNIKSRLGTTLNGTSQQFGDFYQSHCNGAASGCTLKMSVINELRLNSGNRIIPYLEYKITFPGTIADRYTTIQSSGKSYGFRKDLKVRVPQQTVNQALDFTVFQ